MVIRADLGNMRFVRALFIGTYLRYEDAIMFKYGGPTEPLESTLFLTFSIQRRNFLIDQFHRDHFPNPCSNQTSVPFPVRGSNQTSVLVLKLFSKLPFTPISFTRICFVHR